MTSPTFYKFLRSTLVAAALVFMPVYAFADYYVATTGSDSNSGTQSAPFRTIQKAANNASPGITIHVAPGTYAETITSSVSGTASARIRYVSDTKWGAKIVPAAGTGGYIMWDVPGGYNDIDGFEINGTVGGTATRIGIYLHGGNSSVNNSLVQHVAEKSGCDSQGGAGLLATQADGITKINYNFIGNVVHNIGGTCGWINSIYHQSTGKIKNNIVYAGGTAVDMGHDGHNIEVVNNTIFNNYNYAFYFGGCREAYNNGCPTTGINMYNNIVYNNHGGFQGPGNELDSIAIGTNLIKNNIVFGNTITYDLSPNGLANISGNIAADPQFVNYISTGGGDYHVKSTSPAIDRGTSSLAPSTDLDGKPRPQGAGYDIGAYEYGGTVTPPPPPPPPSSPPTVSLSPTSLNFGSVILGNSSTVQYVTVTNTGSATLTFGTDLISGDFAFANLGTCGTSLAPGANCTFSAKFTPTVSGTRTGTMTINTNAAGSPHIVSLTGVGGSTVTPAPILSLSPTSLNFGSVAVGVASTVQTITLTNTGNADLSITSAFAFTGDFTGSGSCHDILLVGASCALNMTFTPTVAGTRTGTITMTTNAAGSPKIVSLTGTGGTTITPPPPPPPPAITTLTNGVVLTSLSGPTGATHMYQLTVPTGATNLRFVSSGGTGDFDLFVKFGSQPTMTVYDAKSVGATTAETVSFAAPQAGTYYLLTNGWAAYSGVSLVGAYTAAVTSAPAVALSSTSLNFGNIVVGNSSTVQYVTVTNTGNATLNLSNVTISGDFAFANLGTCGTSLAPNTSCTYSAKFTPTMTGTRTGTLTITSNAAGSPHIVSLTGVGGSIATPAPILSLSPTSLNFGSVAVGVASTVQTITLTNTGNADLSITSAFAFTGDFIGSGSCHNVLLVGASCALNMTFTPTAAGTRTGTVTIMDNAAGSPHVVSLTGTGGTTITPPPPPPPPPITTLTNGVVLTSLSGATGATHMYQLTVPAGATNLRFVSSGGTGDFDLFVKFGSQPTMTTYDAKSVGATTAETVSFAAPQAGTYYLLTNGWAAYSGVSLVGAYNPPVSSTPAPILSLSPTSLNFGSVAVGVASTVQTITLTNTGNADLSITSAFAFTGDFTGSGSCHDILLVGASCALNMTFTPTAAGTRTGTITMTTNAAGSPKIVSLTGTGVTTTTTTTLTAAHHLYVATTGSDSNAGTQTSPFRTISKAGAVAVPDTIVHVAPGTYAETITTTANGTASGRIRYLSDTKWGAKIVPVAGVYTVWSVSGGYTDIDGFQLDGTGNTSARTGITLNGGNSSVRNSLVQHFAENSGCDSQGGAALHASQYRGAMYNNYDFIGNVVHHIGAGCSWIQGIYHQSTGTIKNNIVYASTYAIHLYHDDHDNVVANNTVFGNSAYGVVYGGCQEGYTNPCPTSGIRVYNNIIYDNRGGIAGPVTAEDVNNVIHNNLVFGNTIQYDLASPSLSSITGAVNADPQFVNYIRTGGGDYHLKSTSPAINAGTGTYAPATDMDGVARPQGGAFDIGAYER